MDNLRYAPNFSSPEEWSERDRYYLAPFVTSMDGLVSVLRNLPPELAGALCSRASRASDSLLRVLLKEYIYPVLAGEDKELAAELEEVVAFFHAHGLKSVLNNKKAQQFHALRRFFKKNGKQISLLHRPRYQRSGSRERIYVGDGFFV